MPKCWIQWFQNEWDLLYFVSPYTIFRTYMYFPPKKNLNDWSNLKSDIVSRPRISILSTECWDFQDRDNFRLGAQIFIFIPQLRFRTLREGCFRRHFRDLKQLYNSVPYLTRLTLFRWRSCSENTHTKIQMPGTGIRTRI